MARREPGHWTWTEVHLDTKDGRRKQRGDGSISEPSCPVSQMFINALPRFRKVNVCSCDDSV